MSPMSDGGINADQTFLIDLDMLLDTRIGVLSHQFPDQFETIDMAGYLNRKTDKPYEYVKGVSAEEWRTAWQRRDVEDLKYSVPTEFLMSLSLMLETLVKQAMTLPVASTVSVDINLYPYVLSDAVIADIASCVKHYVGDAVGVGTVRLRPEQINPNLLKAKYSALVTYSFNDWYSGNSEKLIKTPIPDVTILTPLFYLDKVPSDQEVTYGKDQLVIRPEDGIRMALIEYIQIAFIPTRQVSMVHLPKVNDDAGQ